MRTYTGRVGQWLARLDPEWRQWSGRPLLEFGDCVVYPQVRLEGFAKVRLLLSDISELARKALKHQDIPPDSILNESSVIDLAMLFHLVSVFGATHAPRSQAFFPAVLLERAVLSPMSGEGEPACQLIHRLLAPRYRRSLLEALPNKKFRGFGLRIPWPSPEEAEKLLQALRSCRPEWDRWAERLIGQVDDGRLVVRGAIASREPDVLRLVENLNEARSRESVEMRLERSRTAVERAESILENLRRPEGWFALHIAWVIRVRNFFHRRTIEGRCPHDLGFREILVPISQLGENFAGRSFSIYDQAPGLADARRRQLSRDRAECSLEPLPVVDDEDIDLIRDLMELRTMPRAARLVKR